MPEEPTEVDVVVLGLGSAGQKAAAELAESGLRVVGVEQHLVGGECRYYGCTPTKMMIRAADVVAEARRARSTAGQAAVAGDWSLVAQRIRAEATDDWDDESNTEGLRRSGVDVVHGVARLSGPGEVEVDGVTYAASKGVVLATGTDPAVPDIRGLSRTPYLSNRDIVRWETLPETLTILGGGPIGVEIAQICARFGVEVTLVEEADRILPGEEPEASEVLLEALQADGVDVRTGVAVRSVEHAHGQFRVEVSDSLVLSTPALLVATGRTNRIKDIGLERVGLDPEAEAIPTDEHCRATTGVWAIGDITGEGPFTHVALYQARVAAADITGTGIVSKADYRAVPRVTYTDPEVASVGRTEAQAREDGLDVRVGVADVATSPRGWIHKVGNAGVVKVVEDTETGLLVGATAVGPAGGEVLAPLTLAIHASVPVSTLKTMIYAFPTWHEAILEALLDLD